MYNRNGNGSPAVTWHLIKSAFREFSRKWCDITINQTTKINKNNTNAHKTEIFYPNYLLPPPHLIHGSLSIINISYTANGCGYYSSISYLDYYYHASVDCVNPYILSFCKQFTLQQHKQAYGRASAAVEKLHLFFRIAALFVFYTIVLCINILWKYTATSAYPRIKGLTGERGCPMLPNVR
jgi:hypothetical protein